MTDIKLPKLPDRTPVKLTISITPSLHARLGEYAAMYEAVYGVREPLPDLAAAILASFIETDRDFNRARRDRLRSESR